MGPFSIHQDIVVLPYFHRVSNKTISKWVNLKAELQSYLVDITNHIQGLVLFAFAFLNIEIK